MTQPPDPNIQQPPPADQPTTEDHAPPDQAPTEGNAPPDQPPAQSYPPPDQPPPAGYPPPADPYPSAPPPGVGPLPTAPPPPAGDYAFGQPGTVAVPAGTYLDPASGVLLPQGIELASVGRRIGAYFLAIPLLIVTLFIGYLIWGLIVWGNGQTPALQVLGMRCWRPEEARVPGFWWMALREIVGGIAESIFGIFTEAASFILMVVRRDRRSLHDLIAGTVVVYDPNKTLAR
jgi:uncharacterized RDD family membrane protein YckC